MNFYQIFHNFFCYQLKTQVLNALVEEKLKVQEANRLGIYVSSEEIQDSIRMLEKRNNIKAGQFFKTFMEKNIPQETIISQIRSDLLWEKLIVGMLSQNVIINEREINQELSQIKLNAGKQEYNLSEIFISFANFDSKDEVYRVANTIREKANKKNFKSLVNQFSHSATAAKGGGLGWIRESMLSNDFKKIIGTMNPGEVSAPIESNTGYHIFLLNQKSKTLDPEETKKEYELSHIFFPNQSADINQKNNDLDLAKTISGIANGCDDLTRISKELGSGYGGKLGFIEENNLSDAFLSVVKTLEVGKPSQPLKVENGIHILMLCSPIINQNEETLKNKIENKLRNREIRISADVLLNKIKKGALIDLRI